MRFPGRWVGMLVAAVFAVPGLAAQDLAQVCQALTKLTTGQWASYAISGGGEDGATLRFAIVGTELHNDSTYYWFEAVHTSPADSTKNGIIQVLIPGWGTTASPRAMVMKLGQRPAMKMPEQALAMAPKANPGSEMSRRCGTSQSVGWESITVPAGTLRALHVKDVDGDEAWLTPDVPFGLVKGQRPDGGQMTLTGRGTDAKSSITETPQEMPMMPGMTGHP